MDPRDDARPASDDPPHPADDQAPEPAADRGTPGAGYPGSAEDAAWVAAARSGDELAFGRLFTRWFDPVYDVAWRIVRNPDTAAEVAQDVFLVAWRRLDDLEQPGSFGGWVRRIARNRALNRLDHERRSVPDDEQAAAALDRSAPDVDLTAGLDERDQRELVWAAASALGERDVSVLDLHLRHGLGAGEIAEELGLTTNNAHQLLFRLKRKLGSAITAWVLWRGSRECAQLDAVIASAGVTTFGADAVRAIGRHAQSCTDCTGRQQLRLAPEALFAAMPMAVAPPGLKAEAAAALGDAGVPMSGVTDVGGDAPVGDAGESGAGTGDSAGDVGTGDSAGEAGATPGSELGSVAEPTTGTEHAVASPPPTLVDQAVSSPSPDDDASAAEQGPGPGAMGSPTVFPRRALAGVALVALLAVLGLVTMLAGGDGDDDATETAATAATASAEDAEPDPSTRPPESELEPVTTPPPAAPDAGTAGPTTEATVADSTLVPEVPDTTAPTAGGEPVAPPPAPEEPETPPEAAAPTIGGFRASSGAPCGTSSVEQSVVLAWQSTGAESATISGPGGASSPPVSGTETRCLVSPAGSSFTLTVTGPGGSVDRTATVP